MTMDMLKIKQRKGSDSFSRRAKFGPVDIVALYKELYCFC